jgi:hypothetical protein
MASTTLNVPKITIAQPASPVHLGSRYQKATAAVPSTALIHVPVHITVTKPSTTVSVLSINIKRTWNLAGFVMTLLLDFDSWPQTDHQ